VDCVIQSDFAPGAQPVEAGISQNRKIAKMQKAKKTESKNLGKFCEPKTIVEAKTAESFQTGKKYRELGSILLQKGRVATASRAFPYKSPL
jgi:hypothetical protein